MVEEMPANLTPEYKAAEAESRQARTTEDRLSWMRKMLRTIPKHKGTDHRRLCHRQPRPASHRRCPRGPRPSRVALTTPAAGVSWGP
jgi:hypothetical protein